MFRKEIPSILIKINYIMYEKTKELANLVQKGGKVTAIRRRVPMKFKNSLFGTIVKHLG